MNSSPYLDRSLFTRVCKSDYIKKLLKKAKRLKYNVKTKVKNKDVRGYEVYDLENYDSLVFKAVLVKPNTWSTTFSKVYFREPI